MEEDIEKLRRGIEQEGIDGYTKIRRMALLRHLLGEQEEESTKVVYNSEWNEIECSESIEIGKEVLSLIGKELRENTELGIEQMQELNKLMKDNYYYLARYLFSYFLVAIEFGIAKEKQFYAPRDMVLSKIAKRLDVFYYKPKGILALNMPQGTGKSETGKRFMSWCIGKDPDLPNMMVSYSAAIAKEKFFGGVQAIIEDENGNYQKIFPNLKQLLKSAETMSLDYTNDSNRKNPHSEYTLYCCGFDGGITGRTRAHNVLYLDDLVKNMEAANNKDVMDKMNDEFNATLRKRMQGNCKMLIIGTLFSINDPFSRTIEFFKQHAPERIEILRLPGLNEENETNFPYKYGFALTTEQLLEDKALMDTVSFECLIQQNPIERLGILFSEDEFVKYEEEPVSGIERRIAAVDVAWGGGDSLSMPICSEFSNGDVYLRDVVFHQGPKEVTIPLVVRAIIDNEVSCCFFEANNGGDMYAEKVQEELKKLNYKCNILSGKVPTTKSKLDRILACSGAIKGSSESEFRLLIKYRKAIKHNKMYNDFLDEVFKFNQTPAMQNKQHDDACFDGDTLIATQFGNKKIKDIKIGDKVITPYGLKKVINCGITGYKKTINKFGLNITPNHKVYNKENSKFMPIDSLTSTQQCSKITLKEMIKWRRKLLNLTEKFMKGQKNQDIILKKQREIKTGNIARSYIEQYGNITMGKYPMGIKYIIKTIILTIMTFLIWSVYQLGNIYQCMLRKMSKMKNIVKKCLNVCKEIVKCKKHVKNGINQKKEGLGTENTQKIVYSKILIKKRKFANGAENNISQKEQEVNIVDCHVKEKEWLMQKKKHAGYVEKNLGQQQEQQNYAQKNVEMKVEKGLEIPVYNITVEDAGCYYANGILVSNCDSLASLFTNVLGIKRKGIARSRISREMLGI